MQKVSLLQRQSSEEEAIEFLVKHEPVEGYMLAFGGGKDSEVIKYLAIQAGVLFTSYYSFTTVDPPEIVRHIRAHHPDVKVLYPNWRGHKNLFGMIPEKGFPTKQTRWCCDKLKKEPSMKVPLKHRILGLRAEESWKRAKRPRIEEIDHGSARKQTLYKPIFYWKEWEVWEYIRRHKIPYCSLYDEGFERLGCVVCPFLCNKNQFILDKHKARWPKHYVAFEKAMRKLWDSKERSRQKEFKYASSFEEFLENWYLGNPSKQEPDGQLEFDFCPVHDAFI